MSKLPSLITYLIFFSLAQSLVGCQSKSEALFTSLSSDESGITFKNIIEESPEINILSYEYTYNGGGVAAGDFNKDGMCDLFFTGNAVGNALYINEGNLKFKDVSAASGTEGRKQWKTGVTAADVNADGWLDLYVCYSGPDSTYELSNQLFINNGGKIGGEPTFTERAAEYGLDATGTFSTQAVFFDYDKDGDLDMFLVNHGNHFYSPFINTNALRNMRHPNFGNRLYRNEMVAGGKVGNQVRFKEVSVEAGIHGGGLNFGLGVSIGDVNNDGWPDIFVTNDYEEQDFLYINDGDGTFTDCTKKSFGHISRNGMGTDLSDFNNDGRLDLIEVDMWPEDNYRQKLLKGPDDFNRYNLMLDSGFHHQQMRNTLQMNAGSDAQGNPLFCEVGQLAGVSSTDWSWAPLFSDFDNDGLKDLFVTNGYLRDFTSMDFLKYTVEDEKKKAQLSGRELQLYELVSKMPSTKTSDYIFRNNGDLTFSNMTTEWGLQVPNLAFGAVYADIDNDGDQDLVTNNTNEMATVWVNHQSESPDNHFIQVTLTGPAVNPMGIGSRVTVRAAQTEQIQELYLTRGFQSSVDPAIHFGLGNSTTIESVIVSWPDGKISEVNNVKSNQRINIEYNSGKIRDTPLNEESFIFSDVSEASNVDFHHQENLFNDYDNEALLPYQLSRMGPAVAKGDVNKDGYDDLFIGGAAGQGGELYLSDGQGHFSKSKTSPWQNDAQQEDTGAVFFDAESDGDLDLFVVSGGIEFSQGSPLLDDRLYLNDGKGNFSKADNSGMVADHASGSAVAAADFDKDGDQDLYVGGRVFPGRFPMTSPGAVLKNESNPGSGKIKFSVATNDVNPALREPGMVTDAIWTDFNTDGWQDLIIVGHWMPVRIFENRKGKLNEIKGETLQSSSGLWNRVKEVDVDRDGDPDYILGNAGTNLPWKVSETEPLSIYYSDFNNDGKIDPIISSYIQGINYPVASRDELLFQIAPLRKKFTSYDSYGRARVEDLVDSAQLRKAEKLIVQTLHTSVLQNLGNGKFRLIKLSNEAQISSVNGIVTEDFNQDGAVDILLSGNFHPYRTQYGPSDSSLGLLLTGDGKGRFSPMPFGASGYNAQGDVRNIVALNGANRILIAIGRNNDKMSFFEYRPKNSMNPAGTQ